MYPRNGPITAMIWVDGPISGEHGLSEMEHRDVKWKKKDGISVFDIIERYKIRRIWRIECDSCDFT